MGEISVSGIKDAGLSAGGGLSVVINGGETAQGNAKGKAQVISWGLGIEFFDVLREGGSFWAIDCLLSPFLGVAPGGWAWAPIFDRQLSVTLMDLKDGLECSKYLLRQSNLKDRHASYVAHFKSNPWIQSGHNFTSSR
jgi:hypothetical protein